MVAQYTILGRQVGAHVLAIATLSTTFLGGYLATRGGGSGDKPNSKPAPPIQASSGEEERFIKEFLAAAEEEGAKAKH